METSASQKWDSRKTWSHTFFSCLVVVLGYFVASWGNIIEKWGHAIMTVSHVIVHVRARLWRWRVICLPIHLKGSSVCLYRRSNSVLAPTRICKLWHVGVTGFFIFFLTFDASGSFAGSPRGSLLWLKRLSSQWGLWGQSVVGSIEDEGNTVQYLSDQTPDQNRPRLQQKSWH